MRTRLLQWALAVALGIPGIALASTCTPEHGRVQAGRICLVVKVVATPSTAGRGLAVIVHGDGGGFLREQYLDRLMALAQRIAADRPDDGVVILQRPGYRSPLGYSEGFARLEDDDYTPDNVAHVAAAVRTLRAIWMSARVVWVGHSGGAALGALAMGRESGVADAAVLAGCPCGNIGEWRRHRNLSRGRPGDSLWPRSLSPVAHMSALLPGMRMVLVTGDRDENTVARLSEPWVERARTMGVMAELILVAGAGHGGIIDSEEVATQVLRLMGDIP